MPQGPDRDIAAREVVIAKLTSLARRAPINAAATILNALLLCALLLEWAPLPWLLAWTAVQVAGGVWLFLRARMPRKAPRGTGRGIRLATVTALAAGLSLGALAPLSSGTPLFQRFIVFLTVAAMASGASATLAVVPGAAYGYVLGTLLPVASFWLWQGDFEHTVLAALAGSLALFLLRNASVVHQSFLDSLLQKHETEALRQRFREEQEEWLDLSRGTEAFALLDDGDRLLLCNARFEELVRPFAPVRGASYRELLATQALPRRVDEVPMSREAWIDARLSLHETRRELFEETTDGRHHRVTCKSLPSGRRTLLVVDVTALKKAELALREGEAAMARSQRAEMLGTLAAGVAHDFNNLLMAIRGASQLLGSEARSPEARELLSDIEASVERGSRLTRQLLAAGKRQLLKPVAFDLNEVVKNCASLLRRSIPTSIRFQLDLAEDLLPALADPGQIEQVIINLAINARDAMPSGGVLSIATKNLGTTKVEVTVGDTGAGVDPAILDRVFEPFFTTKPNRFGSGLGLPVAQGIVKQSGGSMVVRNSEAGACFEFTLPVGPIRRANAARGAASGSASRRLGVLVVDDEPMVRKITVRILEARGHRVLHAGDGAGALEILERQDPRIDVLVTDVVMPGMPGPRLAEAARQRLPDLAVVYLTGYDAGALEADASAVVIQKPFDPEELCVTIENAVVELTPADP